MLVHATPARMREKRWDSHLKLASIGNCGGGEPLGHLLGRSGGGRALLVELKVQLAGGGAVELLGAVGGHARHQPAPLLVRAGALWTHKEVGLVKWHGSVKRELKVARSVSDP